MNSEIWFDKEYGIGRAKFTGIFTVDDAPGLLESFQNIFRGKEHSYLLIDLSEGNNQSISKELRDWLKENTSKLNLDKVAISGANPILRMASKIIMAALGRSNNTKFFKSEKEAIAWLKG